MSTTTAPVAVHTYRPVHAVASIEVTVENVEGHEDAVVAQVAMEHANETRTSLYGWHVTRYDDGTAKVYLYRD